MNDAVFALKSQMIPLTVIELSADDSKTFAQQLDAKVQASPALFDHMPAIIGLEAVEPVTESSIQKLLFNVRKHNILPIALKGSNDLKELAKKLDLAWIPPGRKKLQTKAQEAKASIEASESDQSSQEGLEDSTSTNAPEEQASMSNEPPRQLELTESDAQESTELKTSPEAASTTEGSVSSSSDTNTTDLSSEKASLPDHLPTKVISTPVRSGQQIYAKNCDLIVLSQVGQGAEVIADGNIHIYGTLRGRAIAGAGGNKEARIFCQSLQAELISIAGVYQVSEDLPTEKIKQASLVELKENRLHIGTL